MDTLTLIKQAHKGDKASRDKVLTENTALIWSIVRRFLNRGYEGEDLFQIGCIGMLKAIDRFDVNYNVAFSTYAVPLITGEIRRFLRDDGIVKVSRSLKELNTKIGMLKKEYEKQGKELTIPIIQEELKESKENILMAMEIENNIKSMDEEIYKENEENTLYNQIKVESHEEKTINKIILKDELKRLNEKERNIILLRYF